MDKKELILTRAKDLLITIIPEKKFQLSIQGAFSSSLVVNPDNAHKNLLLILLCLFAKNHQFHLQIDRNSFADKRRMITSSHFRYNRTRFTSSSHSSYSIEATQSSLSFCPWSRTLRSNSPKNERRRSGRCWKG